MAEQQRKLRSAPSQRPAREAVDTGATGRDSSRLKSELDDLLDEIDEVLESNAEDFVKSYVQKGGE
jgi:ubiquitin-like protein Pup